MKSLLLQLQGLLKTISILDVLDILVVAYFLFRIYLMLKNTRAATLVKGLLVLAVILFISKWLNLHVITWLLEKSMTVVMVALPVVFQPELRRALEQIGRGLISDSLLLNIFEPDTPLHDGAVVIRGNRIVAASCLLPLTEARNLSQELGTRHRSAIGISEQSDALVLVVSEETGTISLARNGELHRYLTGEDIKSLLRAAVVQPSLNWKQVINDKIKEIRGGK